MEQQSVTFVVCLQLCYVRTVCVCVCVVSVWSECVECVVCCGVYLLSVIVWLRFRLWFQKLLLE